MFYADGILRKSSLIDEIPGIFHGFSTREGGKSVLPHTASLNLSHDLGDPADVVRENFEIFARTISDGAYGGDSTVTLHQIHSAKVRVLTRENAGEGYSIPRGEDGDGFVTAEAGVIPVARAADCVPILLAGLRADGCPVVSAVHAGWRGTVAGIAAEAVRVMLSLGCELPTIRAAIGPHIGYCCYEVGADFFETVCGLCGAEFAGRHITIPEGKAKHHANLTSMNVEILTNAGVDPEKIDVSPDCTMCMSDVYYSHRATAGKRGVHGAGIGIR